MDEIPTIEVKEDGRVHAYIAYTHEPTHTHVHDIMGAGQGLHSLC